MINENKSSNSTIIFCYPFMAPSGASNLFVRLAEHITDHYGTPTRLIDYPNGYMARNRKSGSAVEIIPFADSVRVEIPSDAILVMPSMLPYAMRPELSLDSSTRVVYWHLLFYGLVNVLLPLPGVRNFQFEHQSAYKAIMRTFSPLLYHNLREFAELLVNKKSIIFHDQYMIDQTKAFLGCHVENPIQIPIPINVSTTSCTKSSFDPNHLRFGWVGRFYEFKIHILIYTLEKLSQYALQHKKRITFHIVGDGPEIHRLERANVENDFFKIAHAGVIESKALPEFLLDNVDVIAAMGTSALEGARLGIPAILLDYSFHPIKQDYKFKWLFDVQGDDLGHNMTSADFEPNNTSLERIMDALYGEYAAIAQKSFRYCVDHHGMDVVSAKFLDVVNSATFRFGDTPPRLLKKGLVRRAYEYYKYALKQGYATGRAG